VWQASDRPLNLTASVEMEDIYMLPPFPPKYICIHNKLTSNRKIYITLFLVVTA
jgi:hypothetical protein